MGPYSTMSTDEVRDLIQALSKRELVRLGYERFGISKGRGTSLSRADLIEAILVSADNSDALDIIAVEARRVGRSERG